MELTTRTLDRLIPLAAGSHADVVRYGIDIPMRYAECYAELADGSVTRLRHRGQLLGWSGPAHRLRLWLKAGDRAIRIRTNARRRRYVRSVEAWSGYTAVAALSPADARVRAMAGTPSELVARDGRLLYLTTAAAAEEPAAAKGGRRPAVAVSYATGNPV